MGCEKFNNKECVGKKWCGICPLYEYETDPDYHHIPTPEEAFAMKCQQEYYNQYNLYMKEGKKDKAMSYYSCIQIMERLLQERYH